MRLHVLSGLAVAVGLAGPAAAQIWPIPEQMTTGKGLVWIRPDVEFTYSVAGVAQERSGGCRSTRRHTHPEPGSENGYGDGDGDDDTGSGLPTAAEIVNFAVARTLDRLFEQNFVPWKFFPRNESATFEPGLPGSSGSGSDSSATFVSSVALVQEAADPVGIHTAEPGAVDESYRIDLRADGRTTVTAQTSIGLSRALASFAQLFYAHSSTKPAANGSRRRRTDPPRPLAYTTLAPVAIADKPKYGHRGFNLDIARSFFPVEDIERVIDGLAFAKANRLHLHAIDSQAWPLEIPALPGLAANGAYRPDLVYSPADIARIQRRASIQGVQTVVEIEMPGHTTSVGFTFPELVAAFRHPDWRNNAAQPPVGTLKLNDPAVDAFIGTLLDDLLPRLRHNAGFFHTGADEVSAHAYSFDETINSADPKVIQPFLQKFIDRAHEKVRAHGLTPVVWEETIVDWNLTFPTAGPASGSGSGSGPATGGTVIQSWRTAESVVKIAKQGYRVIAGNYETWYLDCGQGQWVDFVEPADVAQFGPAFADYCSPRKNWRAGYSYEPRDGVPADLHYLVLGGEAHLWSEQTDPHNLDRMLWPRLAAVLEVLWSGNKDGRADGDAILPRNQAAVADRLARFRERLVGMGIASEPVRMVWCSMEKDCVW